ncbi:hypothetical protein [Bradyrhizobium sp. SZCCHNR3118]|uniref:hypothetical protein n=1 Tax=Bradyrhizobium sp. SZCCHNR3118 TaxID=3057468 RepID=UPI0029163A3E|nr:hypothetical protein [Bradyrhizobium sp. SZCCHNR3118]
MTKQLSSTFSYRILACSPDGWARVEYSHELLGSLVNPRVFIPLNHSADEQRGAIVMQFPSQSFHERLLVKLSSVVPLAPKAMEGKFTHRLDRPHDDPVGLPMTTPKV